jgi:hypothetical protein
MTYYCGIDNGLKGGIAIIDEKQDIIFKTPMYIISGKDGDYYDIPRIKSLLGKYPPDIKIALERAFVKLVKIGGKWAASPKAMFTNGTNYGIIQGLLTGMGLSYEIIDPKIWQKKLFEGMPHDDTKQASIMYCKRKYPNIDFRASERCINDHDGITDAVCLANFLSLK